MSSLLKRLRKPVLLTGIFMLVCGIIYPLFLTGVSGVLFPRQSEGSLIYRDGKIVGSELIGQEFTDVRFMKGRPSGKQSASDNYAPTNPALVARVNQDIEEFLKNHPTVKKEDIPADLMSASGSGVDPHISPQSAAIQLPALAEYTGLSIEQLENIVKEHTTPRSLGIFGEETVNVLGVNLEIAEAVGLISSK
ncbi:MAG: potassium-transporting ATPase subunit KdpC [Cellulosilyticaceae bacterium]